MSEYAGPMEKRSDVPGVRGHQNVASNSIAEAAETVRHR